MNPSPLEKQLVGRSALLLPLMREKGITDILINGPQSLFVERDGDLVAETSPFTDRESLLDFIERLLIPVGKRIDAANPYADGRLSDGSRFHIILPPIAIHGPMISIRKMKNYDEISLSSFGPPEIVDWLEQQVKLRKNILIAGGTGSGKTTLLSRLLAKVPPGERIAVIEETQEIQAQHPHLISLEARPPSPEGRGEVTLRTLVRNALRMRPDRIVLGECRGEEAFDMLQAMNTGHSGSLGTIHANSAIDSLKRLESLALLTGLSLPLKVAREWVGSAVQLVVYLERVGGKRQIVEVISVQGLESEVYRVTPRYSLKRGTLANI